MGWQLRAAHNGRRSLQLGRWSAASRGRIGSRRLPAWLVQSGEVLPPPGRAAAHRSTLTTSSGSSRALRAPVAGILGSRSTSRPSASRRWGPGPSRQPVRGDDRWARSPIIGRTHPHHLGVMTAGVFTRNAKLTKLPWFNGRDADENRTNFDYTAAPARFLTSARSDREFRTALERVRVVRLSEKSGTVIPTSRSNRIGASALTTQPGRTRGTWSSP